MNLIFIFFSCFCRPQIYTECSCISQRSSAVRNGGADSISADASATTGDISGATPGAASLVDGEAMEGVCLPDASCAQSLVVFGVVTFITGLIEAMVSSPIYIVFIRFVAIFPHYFYRRLSRSDGAITYLYRIYQVCSNFSSLFLLPA